MKVDAESFKVFSAEARIKIIELLKAAPLSVNTIAESLGISQSAVSQHLRILKQAGMVTDERKGYHIFYSLNKASLDKCQQELVKICTCGCDLGKEKQVVAPKEVLLNFRKRLENELKEVEKKIAELESERS